MQSQAWNTNLKTGDGTMKDSNKMLLTGLLALLAFPAISFGQTGEITFHKDIVPILQRSCQNCHRIGGGGPMSLVTYDEVAPFAGLIEFKTGLRDRAGAMPPWYVEKNIGIQRFKNDTSLNDEEIAAISTWARSGTPKGDPADAPEPLVFDDSIKWKAGTPDLVVKLGELTKLAGTADWWGEIEPVPTGMTEDRYVKSVEVIEVNDIDMTQLSGTVGGRYIFHHMLWFTAQMDSEGNVQRGFNPPWPVHEVGRNADIFDDKTGRLLRAGSAIISDSIHLHSNGRDTTAHLEIGFIFQDRDFEPKYRDSIFFTGNGVDISVVPNQTDQELHAYSILPAHTKIVSFEPHLHAPGTRMCLEAIWGHQVETLSCVGYDHNWVRTYQFEDSAAPLLPEGTILHITGYMNNTDTNMNIPDPRNWQGSGNRSTQNMFLDLGIRVTMNEEQFLEAMAERREVLNMGPNDHVIGCPLCGATLVSPIEAED
jgi:hypothetical protein